MVKERLLAGRLLPKSNFAKALNYYHGLALYLPNYLEIMPTPVSTTTWRNGGIRLLTIDRKNWLFVGNEDGGKASATILLW